MEPLVLVPGLLCDERLFWHQVDHIGDLAEPVVADVTRGSSAPEMASAVLDAAPERFSLAGLSMGGYVALEIMRAAPERVERLALLDTPARSDSPDQTKARRQLVQLAQNGRFGEVARVAPQSDPPRQARRRAAHRYRSRHGGRRRSRGVRASGGGNHRPPRQPRGPGAHRLPHAGALRSRRRADTPPPAEEMASLVPGSRLRVIVACGRLSTLEQPEEVTEALREWLRTMRTS